MGKGTLFAAGLVGVLVVATATQAADFAPVTIVTPIAAEPHSTTAAFVETFGGFDLFNRDFEGDGECQGCHGLGVGFGGNGQAAWRINPALAMQLGVWGEHWSGRSNNDEIDVDWGANRLGIGMHLAYNPNDFLVGVFASVGQRDGFGFGTFATTGVEVAINANRVRLYAQGGLTVGVAPDFIRDEQIRNFYGRLVGTFYATPNIALSANVGGALFRIEGGPAGNLLTWGTRAELQLAGTPLYFLAAYQGAFGRYPTSTVTEHTFRVGLGLNVGSLDLQTRDRIVGLADYNCMYGVAGTPTVECGFNEMISSSD